jgi:hypothetical protein
VLFSLGGVSPCSPPRPLDLFSFVPARIGAQEGARMLAFALGGFEPARGLLSLVLRLGSSRSGRSASCSTRGRSPRSAREGRPAC